MTAIAAAPAASRDRIEETTREIGRELFAHIGRGPSPLRREWWDERFMTLTLDDPEVRVQLFRFIDVLPVLRDDASVRRHLGEYLAEAGPRVPSWLRFALAVSPEGSPGA